MDVQQRKRDPKGWSVPDAVAVICRCVTRGIARRGSFGSGNAGIAGGGSLPMRPLVHGVSQGETTVQRTIAVWQVPLTGGIREVENFEVDILPVRAAVNASAAFRSFFSASRERYEITRHPVPFVLSGHDLHRGQKSPGRPTAGQLPVKWGRSIGQIGDSAPRSA